MKKTIILWLVVAIVVIGGIWWEISKKSAPATKETIKIGAILPLSGKDVEWGEKPQKGIELALEEINKNGKIMEVIYENSESSAEKAVSAAQKLINIDKIQVLMCQLSDICSALAPIAQQNGIVLFGFSNAPDLTQAGDYIFNMRGSANDAGKKLGEFAASRYKSVAVLYLNNPTQKGVYEGFKNAYEANGGRILIAESHNKDDAEFRSVLLKIKDKNPEVLVFASRVANEVSMIKQARELGLNQSIVCSLGTDTKSFVDGLKNSAEKIIYPTAVVSYDTPSIELQSALKKYEQKYGEKMPIWAAESYDSMKLISSFLQKKSNIKSVDIKNLMIGVNGYPGLAGNISFDGKRTVVKDYNIFTVKNGQFVPYEDKQ